MGTTNSGLSLSKDVETQLRRNALRTTGLSLVGLLVVLGISLGSHALTERAAREYNSFAPATLVRAEHEMNSVGPRNTPVTWMTVSYEFVDHRGQSHSGTHRFFSRREYVEPFELRYDRDHPERVRVSWEREEATQGPSLGETVLLSVLLVLFGWAIALATLVVAPLRKLMKIAATPNPLRARILATRSDGKGRVLVEYEIVDAPRAVRGLCWFDAEGAGAPMFADEQRTMIVALGAGASEEVALLQQSGAPFADRAAVDAVLNPPRS